MKIGARPGDKGQVASMSCSYKKYHQKTETKMMNIKLCQSYTAMPVKVFAVTARLLLKTLSLDINQWTLSPSRQCLERKPASTCESGLTLDSSVVLTRISGLKEDKEG